MLTEEDVIQLIKYKNENKNADYKENFYWDKEHKDEKKEIVKDILAMANTQDGGVIIFGIRDDDFELIGLNEEQFSQIDQTKINEFLHKYSDPIHSCNAYKFTIDDKKIGVIEVPEFLNEPIICKKNANSSCDNTNEILKESQIYIRTDKATSEIIPTVEDMRKILGMAIRRKGDELLKNIQILLSGKKIKFNNDYKSHYEQETYDTNIFFNDNFAEKYKDFGFLNFLVYPLDYQEKRFENFIQLREHIDKSTVRHRGWYFPHTDTDRNATNFNNGRQSWSIYKHYIEGYRAYENGYFHWKRILWEDLIYKEKENKHIISFLHIIYSVTEFLIFVKRYYEDVIPFGDIYFKIELNNVMDREMVSLDDMVRLYGPYIAHDDPIIIVKTIKIPELRASYMDIAIDVIKNIFLIFNCESLGDNVISKWQAELVKTSYK